MFPPINDCIALLVVRAATQVQPCIPLTLKRAQINVRRVNVLATYTIGVTFSFCDISGMSDIHPIASKIAIVKIFELGMIPSRFRLLSRSRQI